MTKGQPFDLSFTALDREIINLRDWRGRVVLVDFWATWCPPCLRDMPELLATYKRFRERDFEMVGISLDREEDKLRDYLVAQEIPWPQYFDGKGWRNEIARTRGIKELPYTILLDREGVVVESDLKGRKLDAAIESLLAG